MFFLLDDQVLGLYQYNVIVINRKCLAKHSQFAIAQSSHNCHCGQVGPNSYTNVVYLFILEHRIKKKMKWATASGVECTCT